MNKLTAWMEEHFVPVAGKIGSQRHLVAIRDGFVGIMPITMAGSIAVLLNVFFRDLPGQWGMDSFVEAMQPVITINGNVWWASIAILALVFVFSLGYNLSNSYDINPLAGGLIAFASLIVTTPQAVPDGGPWGYLHIGGYAGATGLFTALFIGLLSTMIYVKLTQHNLIIKLPDTVPPAVNKAFAAIIPGLIAMYVISILTYLVNTYANSSINDLILKYIQMPLLGLSQGLFSIILITLLIQIFWFFGLHGTNVLAPILDGVYLTALNENLAVFERTSDLSQLPWMWTRGSFDAYTMMGGSGITIALIIAIFIASKREDQRQIAKLAAPMGCFNINEPITFGIPIVLNSVYLIPWVLAPVVGVLIGYGFTAAGIIPPVFIATPWIMPPGIYAFLATGGNLLAGAVSLLIVAVAVIIWIPFVKMANKVEQ